MIRDMFAAFADKEIEKSGIAELDKGLFFEIHKRKGSRLKEMRVLCFFTGSRAATYNNQSDNLFINRESNL